ncbi:MAG: hypothetical protein ABJB05_09010 [Parafilimonas sp.]
METGIFKPIIIAISTFFAAIVYTKKRQNKENRLKAIHAKAGNNQDYIKKS